MEVSSSLTDFYTLFRDTDETEGQKRRREDSGDENSALKDILATLLQLDEEQKSEQDKWMVQSEDQGTYYNHQAQPMGDYYNQFQAIWSDCNDIEQIPTKRARQDTSRNVSNAVPLESFNSGGSPQSATGAGSGGGKQRRLWVKDRSKAWWEQYNHPEFPDDAFRNAFRMSKSTFNMICDELETAVTKKDTMLRQAIPVRQRVAVCIWRLATGEPLRLVSKRFGLGISTCHKLVLEVCTAMKTVLMPKFLNWPEPTRIEQIKEEFKLISGIPNVGGSIYTTHVPIIAPKNSVSAYFNRRLTERNQKNSYSITVQGVVDPKGIFTDVCIGWPGSMANETILEKSALYPRAKRGQLNNIKVVGNSSYPLMDWLLVPYSQQNLTWAHHTFNEKIEEIQSVSKEAFIKLKARWSCLQKRTEVKLQELPVVLGACCVLHNICEMRGEEMDSTLRFELYDDEMLPENPVRSAGAVQARDQIAHHLLHHNSGGVAALRS